MKPWFIVLLLAIEGIVFCDRLWADDPWAHIKSSGQHERAPHGRGNIYAPTVLIEDQLWKIWYGAQGKDGHDRICYAESTDGIVWKKQGVVLEDPTANHLNDPCVIKVDNAYWMYYTRAKRDILDEVHLAISSDGKNWKPQGTVLAPGNAGAWDSLSVGRPCVLKDEATYKMWYDGRKDFPLGTPLKNVPLAAESRRSVGYATSIDGRTWQRSSDAPVFQEDAGGIDVFKANGDYWMLFESQEGTRFTRSLDGVTWQTGRPLIGKSFLDLDRFGHVTPHHVSDPSGKSWLFFGAASATTWDHNSIIAVEFPAVKLQQ